MEDVDLLVIRELTGGLYFGKPKRQWETKSGRKAVDTMSYSEKEIIRILKVGFEAAMRRSKRLTSVDKANVLATSRLWRDIAIELAPEYPDVELEHMLVDTCSMRIVDDPSHFDVIVTENTFGDIITDEASVLAGSMGMLPSASLAGIPSEQKRTFGLYEPIHGSAPDIAGQNKANPIGTILSIAMMLRHSLGLDEEAKAVESAVQGTIREGYRTADIATSTEKAIGTDELGSMIASRI
jgi:3-isopropylmalate dehydrogenase